jgi:hypothetical protein
MNMVLAGGGKQMIELSHSPDRTGKRRIIFLLGL